MPSVCTTSLLQEQVTSPRSGGGRGISSHSSSFASDADLKVEDSEKAVAVEVATSASAVLDLLAGVGAVAA